jgi:hypothetical protein
LVEQYSGVVLNQNRQPSNDGDFIVSGGNWTYQEFFFPKDYQRGTTADELATPSLTGWQLLVDALDADDAQIEWVCEYQIFGVGWVQIASGSATGTFATGQLWFDMYFDEPVDVSGFVDSRFRFGFKANTSIDKIWYSAPNPLYATTARATLQDQTPLVSGTDDYSFCFRVLGLTADEGTDFLGNKYRSTVVNATAQNVSTTDGEVDKTWMSKPNPSRFAVESLYFDVRPRQDDVYDTPVNWAKNPSFAKDLTWWTAVNSTGARVTTKQKIGAAAIQLTATSNANSLIRSDNIPVDVGDEVTVSAWFLAGTVARQSLIQFRWLDAANTIVLDEDGVFLVNDLVEWRRGHAMKTAPAGAVSLQIRLYGNYGAQTGELSYIDAIMVSKSGDIDYVDGSFDGYIWGGDANNSVTYKMPSATITDDVAVIDRVLVDPITPNVYFNVYFSSEGAPGSNEDEWEGKLWERVPQTFKATQRESHLLGTPVLAKYIKIEFSHLQAKSYSPGDFAKPVSYKKHPKWVLDYFLARLDTENLSAGRVGVVFDSIDLAYNYYLDDLGQEPTKPVEINNAFIVNQYLQNRGDASDQVDSAILDKITLSLTPYQQHPSNFATSDYLLGQQVRQIATRDPDYPYEKLPITRSNLRDVDSLRNTPVIFEQSYPVMFFYLTCRHKYREIIAPFSHDRAYFVGIREINFSRDIYSVASDTNQYIERAGDETSMERNDFTMDHGVMRV